MMYKKNKDVLKEWEKEHLKLIKKKHKTGCFSFIMFIIVYSVTLILLYIVFFPNTQEMCISIPGKESINKSFSG